MSWLPKNTARKVRADARAGGHDLSRFDAGGDVAIASCRNPGCTVMAEISGTNRWRFIRLGESHETCQASGADTDE